MIELKFTNGAQLYSLYYIEDDSLFKIISHCEGGDSIFLCQNMFTPQPFIYNHGAFIYFDSINLKKFQLIIIYVERNNFVCPGCLPVYYANSITLRKKTGEIKNNYWNTTYYVETIDNYLDATFVVETIKHQVSFHMNQLVYRLEKKIEFSFLFSFYWPFTPNIIIITVL
ncbi:hypothetical protein HZS_8008, partial [Henneguya salminicola]